MPMKTMTTFAIAVALAAAWSVAPALAATTTIEKKDTAGEKFDRAVDKTKDKTIELKDKVVDTTKKAKDKIVDKTEKATDKIAEKTDRMGVRNAQQSLMDKGYNPGPIDGIHGPRTSAAIRDYQKKEGMTVTGQLDNDMTGRLSGTGTPRTGSDGTAPATSSPAASPSAGTSTPQVPAKQTR